MSERSQPGGVDRAAPESTLADDASEQGSSASGDRLTVCAVVLAHDREHALGLVLDRLDALPLDQVIVVDAGSSDDSVAVARRKPGVHVIEAGDVGTAGRNIGAATATTDLLLMLDDDSYPLPGAIETMRGAFERDPLLGALGGLVRDTDEAGTVLSATGLGSFDWFLRAGQEGAPPDGGFPTFFFPEGGCMLRRSAFLACGGFFEPYFLTVSEIDVSTRMLAAGYDVRYLPTAPFDHMKAPGLLRGPSRTLRLRIRNQIWYFWLRFPRAVAIRRIPAYLAFDLVECLFRRTPGSWAGGVRDAIRERASISGMRDPVPESVRRRAEMNRGRMHVRLLGAQLVTKLRRVATRTH